MKSLSKFIIAGIFGGSLALGGYMFIENTAEEGSEAVNTAYQPQQSNPQNQNMHSVNWMSNSSKSGLQDFSRAASASINSVVHVNTKIVRTHVQKDPMLQFFFGPNSGRKRKYEGEGSGSGVIISSDGYIVTNNHVIDNAQEIEIVLNDRSSYKAEVVGADPSTDIALLKVDAKNLNPISFGNSDQVEVGNWVLAVGNPFNLNSTVTAGIVSAKSRNINLLRRKQQRSNGDYVPIESFIQTDAAVNPGNSGGALVNEKGELVGINTAIASNTGSYTGYAFAVPVNLVKKVTKDIMKYGTVQRGYLGVQIRNISQELLDAKDLASTTGVYVAGLVEGGSAAQAGIKEGDVIISVDNQTVGSSSELQEYIGKQSPGDQVIVELKRGSSTKKISVTLKNLQGDTDLISKSEIEKSRALGANFKAVDSEKLKELNINNGVLVSDIHPGKLMSAGIPEGFIITKINHKKVHSPEEASEILTNSDGGILVEGKHEDGSDGYYGFGM